MDKDGGFKCSKAARIAKWARMLGAADASHMKYNTRLGASGTCFELTPCDQNDKMIGLGRCPERQLFFSEAEPTGSASD